MTTAHPEPTTRELAGLYNDPRKVHIEGSINREVVIRIDGAEPLFVFATDLLGLVREAAADAESAAAHPSRPVHSLHVAALTDQDDDPTDAVQYAVLDRGQHHTYGDQEWVASGQALHDAHQNGRVQRRTVTITYGEWVDVGALAAFGPHP